MPFGWDWKEIIIMVFAVMVVAGIIVTAVVVKKSGVEEPDHRQQVGLSVYENPAYNTLRGDVPSTYMNPYFNKQMPLCIGDFYWASSRKSYLPAGESYDLTSYEAIEKAIRAGARLINLDVYPNNDEKWDVKAVPVVRQANLMPIKGSPLDFNRALEIIARAGWIDNKDYPLILYLEIHFNESPTEDDSNPYMDKNVFLCKRIAEAILAHFQSRLLDKKYGFNCRNGLFPFSRIPIADCQGKLILMTNAYPLGGALDELVNCAVTPTEQEVQLIAYDSNYANYGGIAGQHIETSDLIDQNRLHSTLVNPPTVKSLTNIYEPKSDLYNPPISDTSQFGCQFTMVNYQLFDENMQAYLAFFKDASLVLKPESLRYIPRPPKPLNEQKVQNYYAPRTAEVPGWYKWNY